MSYNPQHTARIDGDAFWFKAWLWLWPINRDKVDFCKLFWGFVFAIPNLLLRIVFAPIWVPWKYLIDPAITRIMIRKVDRELTEEWRQERRAKKQRRWERKARIERFLNGVGAFFDRFLVRPIQAIVGNRAVRVTFKGLVYAIAVVAFLAVGYGCYKLVLLIADEPIVLGYVGIGVGAIALFIATVLGSVYTIEETVYGQVVKERVHGMFDSIGVGFWAVKNRTCPRVEIVSGSANEPQSDHGPGSTRGVW